MPRGRQTTMVVDRPIRTTRNSGGAEVVKPLRAKRVADENTGNEAKSRKRAAFGDLTNVSEFLHLNMMLISAESAVSWTVEVYKNETKKNTSPVPKHSFHIYPLVLAKYNAHTLMYQFGNQCNKLKTVKF